MTQQRIFLGLAMGMAGNGTATDRGRRKSFPIAMFFVFISPLAHAALMRENTYFADQIRVRPTRYSITVPDVHPLASTPALFALPEVTSRML